MAKRGLNGIDARIAKLIRDHVDELVVAIEQAVRRGVAADVSAFLADGRASRGGRRRSARILPCIAPGCKNASKGPRFHYLCDEHKGAPRKEYEAWRKARREAGKRAEAGKKAAAG